MALRSLTQKEEGVRREKSAPPVARSSQNPIYSTFEGLALFTKHTNEVLLKIALAKSLSNYIVNFIERTDSKTKFKKNKKTDWRPP